MKLAGSNRASKAEGAEPRIAKSNYFTGRDPAKWRTGVSNYGRVRFAGVYPGIDLVYYGQEGQLEYDWMVKPGADPSRIRLRFEGVQSLRVDADGDLVLKTAGGEIREKKPVIYQGEKSHEIAGRYVLRGPEAGFEVGAYDRSKELVIDPVVVYSAYFGGSATEGANAVAADGAGNAYITGYTDATDFPTVNAEQGSLAGYSNVFISKISADEDEADLLHLFGRNGHRYRHRHCGGFIRQRVSHRLDRVEGFSGRERLSKPILEQDPGLQCVRHETERRR